ncbi:hypothetical protein CBS9595_002106 [Malassezia furfur]|nr:hypothetical protein CBS9595_002106 [Malassezia furfur]
MAGTDRRDAHTTPHDAAHGGRQGSKKRTQSLNHLLAFTLPPRAPAPGGPRRARRHDHRPFNRERYVNAQYRFVMKPTYDCTAQIADADAPLPWADIEQVLVCATSDLPNAHSDTNCPICLSAPSAPRMTRCGHVFCYACILHYLIVAEDGPRPRGVLSHRHSKRCPICWDEVHARDLKAVHWIDARRTAQTFTASYLAAQSAEDGGAAPGAPELTLRLIERPHGTAFALPRSATWPAAARPEGIYSFQPDALVFSRVVLATPELLLASLERDVAEIDKEIVALRAYAPDELSVEFLRVAREKLGEQMAQVRVQLEAPPLRRVQAARNAVEHAAQSAHAAPTQADAYYFYQAASGQNVFLHPLDVKVLLAHFGAYARFPDTLRIVIQHAEEGTMDEQLRRKCKYIAHLPMSSDVTFLEVDWPQTAARFAATQGEIHYAPFETMLRQRRQRHHEKHHREERARAKAEKQAAPPVAPHGPHGDEWAGAEAAMSFRESAMVGAEMYFPRHPGADVEDDAAFGVPLPSVPQRPAASTHKTVWGTPAAPSAGGEALGADAQRFDDAWSALEQAHGSQHDTATEPAQQRAPNAKGQKRKPKLILTGGGRGRG